ncbi:hypothetical protein tb265_29280 [Gemmatimonadetes bacterium T265]|nr:hypothetical protein tb265_29280 [Gemmatimonadetes bacterium T265]
MRRRVRTAAAAAVVAAGACASPGIPPGGPPRFTPPRLVAVAPDTLAVNARPRSVAFTFDEVVNEASRGTGPAASSGGGANGLESMVLVSPRNGSVAVDWGRERISVRQRRGFRANATYTITILQGLSDLRGNARDSAVVAVFSTGAAIARGELRGVVFDWVNGRIAPGAVVEAVAGDSVPYVALSDSTGRFLIPNVPPGAYVVRGAVDVNGNRAIDPREPFDTARATAAVQPGRPFFTPPIRLAVLDSEIVTGADTTRPRPRRPAGRGAAAPDTAPLGIALYAFVHDTLAPRVSTVNVVDSTTVRLTFDRPLRPEQPFGPAQFRIVGPDSAVVPVREVATAAVADSIAQAAARAAAARADSAAPADTTARADTTGRGATRPPPAVGSRPSSAAPPAAARGAPSAADTAARRLAASTSLGPRLQRPVPPVELVARLGMPLRPNTIYRLTARDVRSLSGVAGSTTRTFTTPRPTPPAPAARPAARPPAAPASPPRPPSSPPTRGP